MLNCYDWDSEGGEDDDGEVVSDERCSVILACQEARGILIARVASVLAITYPQFRELLFDEETLHDIAHRWLAA